MNTFNVYVRDRVLFKAGYRCQCGCEKCLGNQALSIHHRVPNTKANRKKYGKWLQSEENAVVLCQYCHTNCKHKFKIRGPV